MKSTLASSFLARLPHFAGRPFGLRLLRMGRWLQRQQRSSTALRQQQQHMLRGDACKSVREMR